MKKYDIAVLGAGLVGLSTALSLSRLGLKVALFEKHSLTPSAMTQDWRSLALSLTSQHFLTHMGVWPVLASEAHPIHFIDVLEKGKFGLVRLDAQQEGLDALGYVIPFALLKAELVKAVRASSIDIFESTQLESATLLAKNWELHFSNQTSKQAQVISAELLLAAEGTDATLSKHLGLTFETADYEQEALVARLEVARAPKNVALERFAETGPLALLPVDSKTTTLVWALPKAHVLPLMQMSEAHFLSALQKEVGFRMGSFKKVIARQSFPLVFHRAHCPVGPRLVLLGNGALSLHPVAGQSFNLALRNVARLHEILKQAKASDQDLGEESILSHYVSSQETDSKRTELFANGLISLFGKENIAARMTRRLGLLALTLIPSAKRKVGQFGSGRLTPLAPLSRE